MKKIAILVTILIVGVLSFFILAKRIRVKPDDGAIGMNRAVLRQVVVEGIGEHSNIVGISIANGTQVIVSVEPKPDILTFFINENRLRLDSKFERQEWTLNALHMLDSLHGYAVGNFGTILSTSDGGRNWREVPRFSEYDLGPIEFADQSNGFVGARLVMKNTSQNSLEGSVKIFRTNDSGRTWSESYGSENEKEVFDFAAHDERLIFASIDGKKLIRTENGGDNWYEVQFPGKSVTGIDFTISGRLWLVGFNGEFLFSIDAGQTWQEPKDLPFGNKKFHWSGIVFDDRYGVAISEEGALVTTTNGGQIWHNSPVKIDEPLRSVSLRDGIGIIVGATNVYLIQLRNEEK